MSVIIRKYQLKDREAVQRVCIETSSIPVDTVNQRELLLSLYCNYYITYSMENCFVIADESNTAVGYVLCSPSLKKWKQEFNKNYSYLVFRLSKHQWFKHKLSYILHSNIARKGYDAHLHIDILPSFQRLGMGSKLIETLVSHLKANGVNGLHLICSKDNIKGMNFYRKFGFSQIKKVGNNMAFGIKLQ